MPAPELTLDRGPVNYTQKPPIERGGWRINATLQQSRMAGPWILTVSTQLHDPNEVPEDAVDWFRSCRFVVPFTHAPTVDLVIKQLQEIVNGFWDEAPIKGVG